MERMSVFVIALVLVTSAFTASEAVSLPDPVLASVTWNKRDGFGIVQGLAEDNDKVVAWGNFTNRINQTGWSYLEIKTNQNYPDKIQVSIYQFSFLF